MAKRLVGARDRDRHLELERIGNRQILLKQRPAVTVGTAGEISRADTAVEIADLRVALRDEVAHRFCHGVLVLHEHALERQVLEGTVEQHKRHLCRQEHLGVLLTELRTDQQDGRGCIPQQVLDLLLVIRLAAVKVHELCLIAVAAALVLDTLDEIREERRVRKDLATVAVRHESDALDAARGHIAVLSGQRQDLLCRLMIDAALAIQGIRYGRCREPRQLTQFLDIDFHGSSLLLSPIHSKRSRRNAQRQRVALLRRRHRPAGSHWDTARTPRSVSRIWPWPTMP